MADEVKEVYRKWHRIIPDETSDSFICRMASFYQNFASSSSTTRLHLPDVAGVDVQFCKEPAIVAYGTFQKFKVENDAETTCISIIRLDMITSGLNDTFVSTDHTSPINTDSKPTRSGPNIANRTRVE